MSTAPSDQDQFPISKDETFIAFQDQFPISETFIAFQDQFPNSKDEILISLRSLREQNLSLVRMLDNLLNPVKEALNYMPKAAKKCPRCESTDTKFCYYNNYSLSQPRHFCKTCRRYWTVGTAIKSIPMRNKHSTVSRKANNSGSTSSTTTYDNSNFVAAAGPAGLLGLVAHHECFTPNKGITTNFSPATPFIEGRDKSQIKPLRGGGVSDSLVKELCISINEDTHHMDFTYGNFPVKFVIANEPKEITTKLMEITLGITGQAAVSLLAYASTSSSSTTSIPGLLRLVVGANAVGFIGTFAAMWFKNKKRAAAASVSGKIGATAAACAVIAAMGMFLPSNAIWIVGFVCLLTALAVAFS